MEHTAIERRELLKRAGVGSAALGGLALTAPGRPPRVVGRRRRHVRSHRRSRERHGGRVQDRHRFGRHRARPAARAGTSTRTRTTRRLASSCSRARSTGTSGTSGSGDLRERPGELWCAGDDPGRYVDWPDRLGLRRVRLRWARQGGRGGGGTRDRLSRLPANPARPVGAGLTPAPRTSPGVCRSCWSRDSRHPELRSENDPVRDALRIILRREHLRRTLTIALVVGTILTAINQADVIARGDATSTTLVKAALNYVVPFIVSNLGLLVGKRAERGG
jgi:hypothetical protein